MRVLVGRHTFVLEEKKSRFIAKAAAVHKIDETAIAVEEMSDREATHNCYAYRIGDSYRFFDDGEPSGTAGKPILAAIDRLELDHCLVLVTRFFGGIKLGAGGLARAYGRCAAECLRSAAKEELVSRIRATVEAPFDAIGGVYTLLQEHGATKHSETFGEGGIVLDLEMEERAFGGFEKAVADATRGRASVSRREVENG